MQKRLFGFGQAPIDMGKFDFQPTEMMFWMYCPVKLPGQQMIVPKTIYNEFSPVLDYFSKWQAQRYEFMEDKYVYVTAKTLFCTPTALGNRPGWHSDGFGTDDLNFIWADSNPTEYAYGPEFSVEDDCDLSLVAFENYGKYKGGKFCREKHLYLLDQKVIHRVAPRDTAGMRSFLKISVSKHKYNLIGNSRNYELDYDWDMKPRGEERNHPCQDFEDNLKTPSEATNEKV